MMYALTLAENNRILSATYAKYAPDLSVAENNYTAVLVDELPEGNISDYLYVDGQYVYDPLPEPEPKPEPEPSDESVWDELDAAYQEGVDSV